MLEPRATPVAATAPTYWLDQIEVAVELPMGPQGEQGPPGTAWIVGAGLTPPTDGTYEDGTLYLGGDGKVWVYTEERGWEYTGVDLIPPPAEVTAHLHNQYLRLAGGTMTGLLEGIDSTFTGSVLVPTPDLPQEAVNLDYLTTAITNLNLQKFFGDSSGYAITTGGSWNASLAQAIYQQTGGQEVPPGVTGLTAGMTMRLSNGNLTQIICDVARNLWFTRTQVNGTFGAWTTLAPIVSMSPPVDPPGAPPVPHGTIWIQTDSTVA